MKKKASEILEKIREYILSSELENTCKTDSKAFSRKRLLSFQCVILQILYLLKESIQISILQICSSLALPMVSKQAFCRARKKVSAEAFIKINEKLCSEFYNDNIIKTFCGRIVLAVDGSTLQLPDSNEIREKYETAKNHLGESTISLGRISQCYDVLNGITVDTILNTCKASERAMAIQHVSNTYHIFEGKTVMYIYDRGYASLTIMFYHWYYKNDFLLRSTLAFLPTNIQVRIKNGETDFIIELKAQKIKGTEKRAEFFKLLPNVPIKSKMNVRIVVIELSTGEKEILITSLMNAEVKYECFKQLYFYRWGSEENYKFYKVRIEIENFSGKSDSVVRQDMYSTILATNVKTIIAREAQEELDETTDWTQYKYVYKINQNIAMGALRDGLVDVLLNPDSDLELFCHNLKQFMKKNTIPIRPERTFLRKRKTKGRKYCMTQRKCI